MARRIGAGWLLPFLLVIPLCAQRGGGHGASRGGGGGHAGLHAGGGHGGANFNGGGSGGSRFRGFSNGFGGRGYYGFGLGFYSPWLGTYPYAYYDSDYGSDAYAPPALYYNDVPPVVINQQFQPEVVVPQVREYLTAPPQPPPPLPPDRATEPGQSTSAEIEPLYLLATKDGTIRAVVAYWAEGASVHYVTMDHARQTVPLNSIDRELSARLNRERGVSFGLPK